MQYRRMRNSANRCSRQSRNEMNEASQPFIHVARIQERITGEHQTQAHQKNSDYGECGCGATVVIGGRIGF